MNLDVQNLLEELNQVYKLLDRADEIILDIHSQVTTWSKYTASRVYDWKDLRGSAATLNIREFDDNGRDEELITEEERESHISLDGPTALEEWKDSYNKGYFEE